MKYGGIDMNEIIEIYTDSKTFDNIGDNTKEINRIRNEVESFSFEEVARYIFENPNGKNILTELQISTKWCKDNDIEEFMEIVAYKFDDDIENYSADLEIGNIDFDGDFTSAIEQMRESALKLANKI